MKNFLIALLFAIPLVSQSQIDVTTNVFNPDINVTAQFKVLDRLYVGGTIDFADSSSSVMFDGRFIVVETKRKLRFVLLNGYSLGADYEGLATAFYLTEQFYYKDFPLGLSIYQRAYMGAESGVSLQARIGIVWDFYQKRKKKELEKKI